MDDYNIGEQLREYIRKDPRTTYAIAKKAVVDTSAMYKFLDSKGSFSLEATERICSVLGLSLQKIVEEESSE